MAGGGTWTTPKTWTAAVVSVADMLTHVRDNLNALTQAATTITTTGTQTALALPVGRGDLVIYANNATALTVQGIAAGEDGQRLRIFSKGAGTIALNDQNVGASAANRIITGASATVDLIAGSGRAELVYDLTTTRWRIAATVATAIVPISAAATVGTTLAVTGVTTVAAGSAATPSVVSVTGTADTGVFFPAADTIAASTAGSERLRIDSSGNVGIANTSPLTKLHILGGDTAPSGELGGLIVGGTTTAYRLALGYNVTSNYGWMQSVQSGVSNTSLVLNSQGGNVGIGTTGPVAPLDVKTVDAGVGTKTMVAVFGRTDAATSTTERAAGVVFSDAANGPTVTAGVAGIRQNSFTDYNGALAFYASNAGAAAPATTLSGLTERMRITSAGNVGIGLTGPVYQLQVNTDSAGKPGVGGVWTVVSDERIKTDIVDADLDRCYDIVKAVPLKHFGFKPGVYTDEQIQDKHSLGWIAQDVQAVFEKAVSVKPFTIHTPQADGTVQDEVIDDCLDLNSGQMIAALYGCVQALMAKVEALEAR
jgi:hypothetical protein